MAARRSGAAPPDRDPPVRPPTPRQTREYVRSLLERHGLRPRKSVGQHFLINDAVLDRVVAACELTSDSFAIEVGAGIGNLSTRLAEVAGAVRAIEIDEGFRDLHGKMADVYENLTFVYRDALDVDWGAWADELRGRWGDIVVAGNIPYQIGSPLVGGLLESSLPWGRIVFTVQREVADRFCARPATKAYGALTLKIAALCQAEVVAAVGPENFHPPPRVESAIVRLVRRSEPMEDAARDKRRFFRFCDGLFAHRRKQAPNSLARAGALGRSQADWVAAFDACGLDPRRRGETLTLDEARALFRHARSLATDA